MTARGEMVPISGGVMLMGSDDFYPDERPVHRRVVADFAIDRYPVTNRRFADFVAATGYVTVAERPLDPTAFPGADPEDLVPGGMVFVPTAGPVDLAHWRQWWRWVPGASWRHPEGPESGIDDRMDHPVTQVAYEDALAYASWTGARLPTEAEFEYAARGGHRGRAFAWGDEPFPSGRAMANTWLGRFPYLHTGPSGARTTAVGSFPPNDYGLHDMIGNVWEWTSDLYTARHVDPALTPPDREERPNLLTGRGPAERRRTLKGGSYLCAPEYCLRFRPAARSPQSEDTSTTHIGFRCAA